MTVIASGEIDVRLSPAAQSRLENDLNAGLKRSAGSAGGPAGDDFGKHFKGSFSNTLKSVAGLAAGIFAGIGATKIFGDVISEAREAAKVGRLTTAVVKSTGGVAGVTAKHVGDLADQLSVLAGVDDELVQSGENVLLTFTNVRNSVGKGNDIFDQGTKAALDMSSALGTDFQGAIIQVGKALNDPIKGVTALSKVGVSFTQQQKDQIKTLVASGKTLDAQRIILKELQSEFGGAAAAATDPMARLGVVFKNLEETVGAALLPVLDKVATFLAAHLPGALATAGKAFGAIKDAIAPFGNAMANLLAGFRGTESEFIGPLDESLFNLGQTLRVQVLPILQKIGDFIRDHVTVVLVGFGAALLALTSPVTAVVATLTVLYVRFQVVRDVVGEVSAFIVEQVGNFSAFIQETLPQVQEAVGHFVEVVRAAWQLFGDDILRIVGGVFTTISGVIRGALEVVENVIRLVLALINGDWTAAADAWLGIINGVWTAIRAVFEGAMQQLLGVVGLGFHALVAVVGAELQGFYNEIKGIATAVLGAVAGIGGWLVNAGADLIRGFINGVRSMAGSLISAIKNTITDRLPGFVKKALGIESPSKMFFGFGANVVQGFVDGIVAGLPQVSAAIEQMTAAVTPESSATRGGGFGADDWFPNAGENWLWNGKQWVLGSAGGSGAATATGPDGRVQTWTGQQGQPWQDQRSIEININNPPQDSEATAQIVARKLGQASQR